MSKRRKKAKVKFYLLISILLLVAVVAYKEFGNRSKSYDLVNIPELPSGFSSYGIDISHHQGEIDWDIVLAASDSIISFVYCKATEGLNHIDTEWSTNREILVSKNIPNGAYHFFLPKKDALKQAKHFLRNYNPNQNDLPPVLDAEIDGVNDDKLVAGMKVWLKHVEQETGKRPIIYTSYNFYKEKLLGNFEGYNYWIANYNTIEERFKDEAILHWQFSDNGTVPGIDGPVDLNFSKIKFN